MDNQYQMLKKENRIRAKCMSAESQAAYRAAVVYFKRSNRQIYDTELMYKELIGIGLSADARGESLALAIGENPKEFYESLVENARPNTIWNILSLLLFPTIFATYFVLAVLICFLIPSLRSMPFTLFGLISMAVGVLVLFLLTAWEKRRNVNNSKHVQLIYVSVFALTMCLQIQLGKLIPQLTLFVIPAWLVATISGIFWYVSCRYRNHYYLRIAKERPWQD